MKIKNCIKCKNNLPLNRTSKYCTSCKNEIDLKSYHKNKEKRRQYSKQYEIKNPDKLKKGREQTKQWLRNHPEYMNGWYKEKLSTNIEYKIIHNLRERLRAALHNNSKGAKTMDMLGCNMEEFKQYLTSKFTEGMNWDNYGRKGWHIDHIKPCASFDLSDYNQQKQCFHYTNLQPLWWNDNLRKSAKY
jgi:hypothetical protein